MDGEQKKNRISRIKLSNIAHANLYQPVTERNNMFYRVKRNSAVLARVYHRQNDAHSFIQQGQSGNFESRLNMMTKNQSENQIKSSRRYSSSPASSLNSLKKRKPLDHLLPQMRKSKQLSVSSPTKSLVFDDSQNSSKNEIQGTQIGVLSTKQILKKYEIKKLMEEMSKKKFLDEYIKNMKPDGFEVDQENEEIQTDKKDNKKQKLRKRAESISIKSKNLSQSQNKLVDLLENRLTDRDYIDFNVKLFEKRDINQRKFFQRYHNILKQQRQNIAKG